MSAALSVVAVIGILSLLALRGLAHFWPSNVAYLELGTAAGNQVLLGEISEREIISKRQYLEANPTAAEPTTDEIVRVLLKTGNRKVNPPDFRWVFDHDIKAKSFPPDVVVIERTEWGHAYGYLDSLHENGSSIEGDSPWLALQDRISRIENIRDELDALQNSEVNRINFSIEKLRLEGRRRELDGNFDVADLEAERELLQTEYEETATQLFALNEQLSRDRITLRLADGSTTELSLSEIVQAWQPNQMSVLEKLGLYFKNLWSFLSDDPREANTEGGIYPALFGTVLMVLLMSVFVTPFGVVAAIYLREYAKQGPLVQLIRIAVNNLAGVPSIVYGVFGLGFFVYFVGGSIDTLLFPEAKPAPTFGTPGLIWASLTLALLTVPVVIVSTEEGTDSHPSRIAGR